ncbi:MAG TPA: transcription antitermination factor NusB [Jatrophihabitantaceae bacterium]
MPTRHDLPRAVALDLLRAVANDEAYANLTLPRLISGAGLSGRDAALATELGYGTLRATGTLDAVLAACLDRPLAALDVDVLLLLRLGAYQLLRTRIPDHAAVATTVELARTEGAARASGLVNAVLRRVSDRSWDSWVDHLAAGSSDLRRVALRTAHPEWIVTAFAAALGDDLAEPHSDTVAALDADDQRPQTHLVAWPGRVDRDTLLAEAGGQAGPYSPYAVRMSGGDPAAVASVAQRRAAVQDEGSQLCALALADAPLQGTDSRWLDLCAGPGGKTALLAALGSTRAATVTANELRPHRAELVRAATAPWHVEVHVGDARQFGGPDAAGRDGYDRVLLDAPCTGLGALRRRPEARWRRTEADVPVLADLQEELLRAALALTRPGGVVAYVTCSPHPAETVDVLARVVDPEALLDAGAVLQVPDCHVGPGGRAAQLWPHRHGTDAMFCALIRR